MRLLRFQSNDVQENKQILFPMLGIGMIFEFKTLSLSTDRLQNLISWNLLFSAETVSSEEKKMISLLHPFKTQSNFPHQNKTKIKPGMI